jgi:outer membrane murein-binding lipoprotein Lpp
LDATTLGSLLVGVGAVVGGLVAYLGKRGENALTGYSSLTGTLQKERDRLDAKVTELNAKVAELSALRAADQAEITRLRTLIPPGGQP